jgi:hypothetical protein
MSPARSRTNGERDAGSQSPGAPTGGGPPEAPAATDQTPAGATAWGMHRSSYSAMTISPASGPQAGH